MEEECFQPDSEMMQKAWSQTELEDAEVEKREEGEINGNDPIRAGLFYFRNYGPIGLKDVRAYVIKDVGPPQEEGISLLVETANPIELDNNLGPVLMCLSSKIVAVGAEQSLCQFVFRRLIVLKYQLVENEIICECYWLNDPDVALQLHHVSLVEGFDVEGSSEWHNHLPWPGGLPPPNLHARRASPRLLVVAARKKNERIVTNSVLALVIYSMKGDGEEDEEEECGSDDEGRRLADISLLPLSVRGYSSDGGREEEECIGSINEQALNDPDVALQLHHVSLVEGFDVEGSSEVGVHPELHHHSVIMWHNQLPWPGGLPPPNLHARRASPRLLVVAARKKNERIVTNSVLALVIYSMKGDGEEDEEEECGSDDEGRRLADISLLPLSVRGYSSDGGRDEEECIGSVNEQAWKRRTPAKSFGWDSQFWQPMILICYCWNFTDLEAFPDLEVMLMSLTAPNGLM
ncbi:hypothetical protein RHSIM_Rhsim06G0119200 [Rhododendron simsii]|uniref:Uncharacterized protein n=1 Tax=Rhododendron simsii TaxID=118357 RepID=A0A834LI33_RHOSS|nr:hypothetical protein RHSIM_Rhsim06G0119200 [Rhododendron simsii]